jgi:hypothetical protein
VELLKRDAVRSTVFKENLDAAVFILEDLYKFVYQVDSNSVDNSMEDENAFDLKELTQY